MIAITASSCTGKNQKPAWVENALSTASCQLEQSAIKYEAIDSMPRTFTAGRVVLVDKQDWTSGFFPGSLWQMYRLTGKEIFKAEAGKYTSKLYDIQYYKGNHDVGFMMFCSYGNQYLITHDSLSPRVLIQTAQSLLSRYNEKVGLIRSWDFGKWNYPVIIDNMMNLELLFWASKYTGDPQYENVAINHADNTIKNHFRPDYSSYHVVSYNDDGSVESKGTFQGCSDTSAWARGQAWGLYGYTVCFRETKLERYLEQAEHIAGFIMNNPVIAEDRIPYWDYNAPGIPDAPRDASAAAITASALIELSTLVKDVKLAKEYLTYAETILKNLAGNRYLAKRGENGGFVLMHSTGHKPENREVDVPLNYADYYFLEALNRYLALNLKTLNKPKTYS